MKSLVFGASEYESLPKSPAGLKLLNGGYAAAYRDGKRLMLFRDPIGIVPLYYSLTPKLTYSDRFIGPLELNPRTILSFNGKRVSRKKLPNQFTTTPRLRLDYVDIRQQLKELIVTAVDERSAGRVGVFFSGGLDSSVIALILKKLGRGVLCYTAGITRPGCKLPEDVVFAKRAARALKLKLKVILISHKEVEALVKEIIPLTGDKTVVNVGVSIPLFLSARAAKRDGVSHVFSGLGSEECFAGYRRHRKAEHVNMECRLGMFNLYRRDTFRDYAISKHFSLKLMVPFLDRRVVDFSLRIPPNYKINQGVSKLVLRDIAHDLGLPKWIATRPKRAAQYGSGSDKAISKLARAKGFHYKTDYLKGLVQ